MFNKRNSNNNHTVPMLIYWTRRYVLVLLCCLVVLAVVSGIWLRINAYEHSYNLLELRAEQLVELYGQMPQESLFIERLQQAEPTRPKFGPSIPGVVQIADGAGNIIFINNEENTNTYASLLGELSLLHKDVLSGQKIHEEVKAGSKTWLRVGVPIYEKGTITKALYISTPAKSVLEQVSRLYGSLALLTGIITLAGWFVLYFLSRRLTRPLREIAEATHSIAEGIYDPVLPQQIKERELQQLVGSFQNMANQLKNLEQLRNDLLAGVSHELRTPITSIRGMVQAVQNKVVTGKDAEEFLQITLNEAKRLQNMVEDLLDFSSFEAGAAPIRGEPVELVQLVDEVIQQISILPDFSDVRFERILPVEPVWIKGDAERLRQILLNLLDNSKKASATSIKIALLEDNSQIKLDLADNGKGISPSDQPYVFERFYRGSASQKKVRGLGLGLTISRLLARAHGGDLLLMHTCAGGTTFRICLKPIT